MLKILKLPPQPLFALPEHTSLPLSITSWRRLFCLESCRPRHQGIAKIARSNSAVRRPYHIGNSVNAAQTEDGTQLTAPAKFMGRHARLVGDRLSAAATHTSFGTS